MILQVQGGRQFKLKGSRGGNSAEADCLGSACRDQLGSFRGGGAREAAEFAQEYLEKLINLEVRVPLAIEASSIGDSALDPFLVRGNFPFAREPDTTPGVPIASSRST